MTDSYLPDTVADARHINDGAEYSSVLSTIDGVVSDERQGGWFSGDGNYMLHCFYLYRANRSANDAEPMTIIRAIPLGGNMFAEFTSGQAVRLEAYLSEDGRSAALKAHEHLADAAISTPDQIGKNLDSTLGPLSFDTKNIRYCGSLTWENEAVPFYMYGKSDAHNRVVLLSRLRDDSIRISESLRQGIIQSISPLLLDWYHIDNRPSNQELLKRMNLDSIHLPDEDDGRVEFWFDDDDIFAGHFVRVLCSTAPFGVRETSLQG